MSLDQVANFIKVTVAGGYGPTDTVLELAAGQGARLPDPAAGCYNLVFWKATDYVDPADDPNVEIVRAVSLLDDTLTVLRAQEGTTATQKQNLNKVYKLMLGLTAKMILDMAALATPTTLKTIAVTGSVPGTDFVAASSHTGSSIIFNNNTTFIEGTDYTCSGTDVTWLYPLPDGYSGTMTLVCIG
jgi:hypothetical protein